MASAARKKITLIEMHAALIALGHENCGGVLRYRKDVNRGVSDCDLGQFCCGTERSRCLHQRLGCYG